MSPWAGPVLNGFFLLLLACFFPCSSEDHPWPRSFRGAPALAWVTLGCSPLRLSPLWYGSPLCPKTSPSLWLLHASAQKHLPMCPLPFVAAAFSEMHLSRDTTCPFNVEVLAGNGLLTLVQSWLDVAVTCSGQLMTFSHATSSYPNAASYAQYNRY